jgi:hypothetical protein
MIEYGLIMAMIKKIKIIILAIVTILILIAIAWYVISTFFVSSELQEEAPSSATLYAMGTFQSGAHPTSGTASILDANTTFVLRLENFKTDDGPGLYVYLSTDLEANDYIDLGRLKATEGDFNYEIDSEIDFNTYNKVLIWCEPVSVLFGHAELTIEDN